jgi:UDP-N-acetylglucosamine diphosphorylase/glucosamine-1-phosphate N-acetyltransferase
MNVILFDLPKARLAFRPFTDTRPLAQIRVGITTIEEKWQSHLIGDYSFLTAPYLSKKFPQITKATNYYVNGAIFPTQSLVKAIEQLQVQEQLIQGDTLLAFVDDKPADLTLYETNFSNLSFRKVTFEGAITQLKNKWDIFLYNEQFLLEDFQNIQSSHHSHPIQDPHTRIYNESAIYIAQGVSIKAAILNAELGPIYIGPQAIIEEGAIIRGPVAICEHAQVKAGAVINQATTIGPYTKVGGEVSNSVIFGYSNKVHHGFLGNSVIGEWCNLGGGTTTSNLKINYSNIKLWDYEQEQLIRTDLQFCGSFIGDYSRCGINTMFNAGTVVGVSTNLFGTGYHHKFVPSFTRGTPENNDTIYKLDKALETASIAMQRRGKILTEPDQAILDYLAQEAITDRIKARL